MQKKKIQIKKYCRFILKMTMMFIILFSVNKTISGYKTTAQVSTLNALPILNIEVAEPIKELKFIDYGWATHSFDIVNGKHDKDGIFYVNEVDMEYYINVVQDSGDLPLNLRALYILNDDWSLKGDTIPYVEGKGYGPFDLPYKVDDQTILNSSGYYESKYVSRVHYMLVYAYGSCESGSQTCEIDANDAGKDYKFHIEVKAYQK